MSESAGKLTGPVGCCNDSGMHPEIWEIPYIHFSIKSYGLMMTIGFLTASWLAMRRAMRVKCDPDVILNCCLIALVSGVVGSRIFYVIHYWKTQFAPDENPLLSAINITAGGLEFYGGLIGAIVAVPGYLALKRQSIRLYMDILAISTMWGLSISRIGCFLNGCCWGDLCVTGDGGKALPWAVEFPFASGPHMRQLENRQVTLPAPLLHQYNLPIGTGPIARDLISLSVENREMPERAVAEAQEVLSKAKEDGVTGEELAKLEQRLEQVRRQAIPLFGQLQTIDTARAYASPEHPDRKMTHSELASLASHYHSLPVHPTQLYSTINAMLICFVLMAIFNRRKRHGVVIGWMIIMYAVSRFFIEGLRADQPHDVGGLTVSQGVALAMLATGVTILVVVYKFLPLRSPRAVAWAPPQEEGRPAPA